MTGTGKIKRRSIADVDKDMTQMGGKIDHIVGVLTQLFNKANEPAPEPEKTAAEKAHATEFPDYDKQERTETQPLATMMLPEFEMPAYIGQWIIDVAKYHERSVEQELQLMIKKLYFASKATMEAEMSRSTTLSGVDKG